IIKMLQQDGGGCPFEVIGGLFELILVKDITVGQDAPVGGSGPYQVVNALDLLQVHGQPLQPVGDFAHGRVAVQAANLLKIRELCDLHAVEPDFPAQAPCAQRGVLPVVFDKADIMLGGVDTDFSQGPDVQV